MPSSPTWVPGAPTRVEARMGAPRALIDTSAVTEASASISGLRLHYRRLGDLTAPSVVVLHGIMGHSREWDTLTRALATHFAVTALDQRGHGQSDWANEYTATSMAADLVGLLDHLDLPRTHLIGHSMGGMAGLLVAAQYPSRVEKLVIVDVGPDSITTDLASELVTTLHTFAEAAYTDPEQAVAEWLAGNPLARESLMRHYVVHTLARREDGWLRWRFDAAGLQRFVTDGVSEGQLWHAVDSVAAPTLVIRGEHSPVLTRSAAQRMVARLAHGRLVEIPDGGHDLGVEQPERVAAAIRQFLL